MTRWSWKYLDRTAPNIFVITNTVFNNLSFDNLSYNGTKKKNMHSISTTPVSSQADNIGTDTKCPSKKVMSVLQRVKERESKEKQGDHA